MKGNGREAVEVTITMFGIGINRYPLASYDCERIARVPSTLAEAYLLSGSICRRPDGVIGGEQMT